MRTAQQRYETKGNLTSDRVWGYQYDAFGRQIERRTSGSSVTTHGVITAVETTPGSIAENQRALSLLTQHTLTTGTALQTVVADHKSTDLVPVCA